MSLLNSEATKEVLLEQDILSTSGRVQSIWDTFTANMNPNNDDNDLLQLIISSFRTKFIQKLGYGYSDSIELEELIGQFQDLVDDVCKNTNKNVLSVFLLALANALSKSVSTKNQSSTNIEINMTESCADISLSDTTKTVSLLERHGLLDSNQLQSLLDDRSLALTKACTELGQRLDTPIVKDSGEDILPLGLKDFIPNFDKIMDNIKMLCNEGIDRFPTYSELSSFFAMSGNLGETKLYHPKTYQSNIANSMIINATNNYLTDCFDMDVSTAMYALSSIESKLKETVDQIGQVSSLIYSQIIVKTILLKMIKEENADLVSARDVLSEEYLKYAHVVKRLETQLKSLITELDNSSVFVKTNLFRRNQLDEYVNFVRNSHSWDAEDLTEPMTNRLEERHKGIHKDLRLEDDTLEAELNELLTSLDKVTSEIEKYYIGESADWDGDYTGISEALSSPIMGFEQVTEIKNQRDSINSRLCSLVVENGKSIHSELNQSLLDGNFESAANSIAREMALENFMTTLTVKDKATMAELQSVKESIERDVSTYTGILNHSVPGGISKYEESATSYIGDIMKTNNLT